jgi:acetyl-CoA carboxylase carboxyl transferase subunit alpha
MDYVDRLVTEWVELHGDRGFADDRAIVGGMGRFQGEPLLVVGTQKGRDTKENLLRRFGMANPEGYRKALRLMQLAGNFGAPILSLVDTAARFPASAPRSAARPRRSRATCARCRGSRCRSCRSSRRGRLGRCARARDGDIVLMFENSIYSVISPEGCASILWRDRSRSQQAADALRLTAADCLELGIVDSILPEPVGGAHRDPEAAARALSDALERHLKELRALPVRELVARRRAKFRAMGVFSGG